VIIRPTSAAALWGKVQEIRDAIVDFRRSGKPIIGYLEYGGEQEFYLASACDKVFLMPTASLDLTGMASYELFLRGTLDKIGAYPDTLHIGDYKTARTRSPSTPSRPRIARWRSRSTRPLRTVDRGHRRRPAQVGEGRARARRSRPFLPEDASAPASSTTWRTRTRSTTRCSCRRERRTSLTRAIPPRRPLRSG
jgi:hypothetical protein